MNLTNRRMVLALSCSQFLVLGMITASFGPVLPDFAKNTGSSLVAVGGVFTALFLGALVAQVITGPINDHFGERPVIIIGTLVLAVGSFFISRSHSLALLLGITFITGIGHGATDLSNNLIIARLFRDRSVSVLNLLHLFYGIGCFAGPALVSLTLYLWETGVPVLWIAAGLFFVQLLFVFRLPGRAVGAEAKSPVSSTKGLYNSPVLWFLGLLLMLFVGVEQGMGGWTTTFIQKSTASSISLAAFVTSLYWVALAAGRLTGAAVGGRMSSMRVLILCLVGSLVGGLFQVVGMGSFAPAVAAIMVLGFFHGPIFPTVIAITTGAFPKAPGKATGVVVSLASIGGLSFPWLQGLLLDRVGPAASAWFIAGGCALLLAVFGGLSLLLKSYAGEKIANIA